MTDRNARASSRAKRVTTSLPSFGLALFLWRAGGATERHVYLFGRASHSFSAPGSSPITPRARARRDSTTFETLAVSSKQKRTCVYFSRWKAR
jgi:hypothetical protein